MLASELKKLGPEEKRAHARELVISFAGSPPKSGKFLGVKAFRNHFDSQKMLALKKQLGVDFQKLIDGLFEDGSLHVTNGIVWVRK